MTATDKQAWFMHETEVKHRWYRTQVRRVKFDFNIDELMKVRHKFSIHAYALVDLEDLRNFHFSTQVAIVYDDP